MAISFKQRGKVTAKNLNYRDLIDEMLIPETGKRLQTNQIERITAEILASGYPMERQTLIDYKALKQHFPRVMFSKKVFELTKDKLRKYKEDVTAEEVYNLLKSISSEIQDGNIYYWFRKLGIEFTTKGVYTKEIVFFVVYAAIAGTERKNAK